MSGKETIHQALKNRDALTVGAIASPDGLKLSNDELQSACDVVELRLDALGWGEDVLQFAQKCPLPLLMTARGAKEGGANDLSPQEREDAYRALLDIAAFIDIEMRDFSHFGPLLQEARDKNILIIGSFHDFHQTPPLAELREKLTTKADIHKYALQTQNRDDLSVLLELLDQSTSSLSVMGMGPLGAAARPLLAYAGSLLNYGYLGETPTAPGQWPAHLLKQAICITQDSFT